MANSGVGNGWTILPPITIYLLRSKEQIILGFKSVLENKLFYFIKKMRVYA